jgi:3'-phosphoadenosine 5'-phosphosulfate (PAPS) 3'-phosphatase
VWIDPIDNTKGFINGTLDCVTVLIGLSRNKRAYIGVVGVPYLKNKEELEFKPEVLVGCV